jgi:hypothetical protein
MKIVKIALYGSVLLISGFMGWFLYEKRLNDKLEERRKYMIELGREKVKQLNLVWNAKAGLEFGMKNKKFSNYLEITDKKVFYNEKLKKELTIEFKNISDQVITNIYLCYIGQKWADFSLNNDLTITYPSYYPVGEPFVRGPEYNFDVILYPNQYFSIVLPLPEGRIHREIDVTEPLLDNIRFIDGTILADKDITMINPFLREKLGPAYEKDIEVIYDEIKKEYENREEKELDIFNYYRKRGEERVKLKNWNESEQVKE